MTPTEKARAEVGAIVAGMVKRGHPVEATDKRDHRPNHIPVDQISPWTDDVNQITGATWFEENLARVLVGGWWSKGAMIDLLILARAQAFRAGEIAMRERAAEVVEAYSESINGTARSSLGSKATVSAPRTSPPSAPSSPREASVAKGELTAAQKAQKQRMLDDKFNRYPVELRRAIKGARRGPYAWGIARCEDCASELHYEYGSIAWGCHRRDLCAGCLGKESGILVAEKIKEIFRPPHPAGRLTLDSASRREE